MKAGIALILFAALLTAATYQSCPEYLRIGLTYAEVKNGPCKDIGVQAVDTLQGDPGDPPGMYPIYLCESQKVLVVGSRYTGKTVGLIQWR